MNTIEHLPIRLRGLMMHLGIKKKEDLAQRLGYSRTQLYSIETGKLPPTERFWNSLAQLENSSGFSKNRHIYGLQDADQERTDVQQDDADLSPPPQLRPASDAEITGLAALLFHDAASRMDDTGKGATLPDVRRALEVALRSRGVLK
jgi:transcriptional regulator with XRE-family HTH domain